jgi:hypothetical protein
VHGTHGRWPVLCRIKVGALVDVLVLWHHAALQRRQVPGLGLEPADREVTSRVKAQPALRRQDRGGHGTVLERRRTGLARRRPWSPLAFFRRTVIAAVGRYGSPPWCVVGSYEKSRLIPGRSVRLVSAS